jgi:hypothetical protein
MSVPSAPFTFTYTTGPNDALFVTGLGPIRREDVAPSITDTLGEPNRCELTGGSAADATRLGVSHLPPVAGVSVTVDTLGRRVFAGSVVTTTLTYQGKVNQLKWDATIIDPTRPFNRLVPFETYTAVSATTVVLDLIATYAPGFTGDHVQAGLPAITVSFDGSKNLGGCLDEICDLLSAPKSWKVDYDNDVHLTLTPETDEVPDDLVDGSPTLMLEPVIRLTEDVSQLRNRAFVRGTGVFTTRNDPSSQGLYGVWEAPVIDRPELTTTEQCDAYGDAVNAVFALPIKTLEYATRDPKTASGKTVTANLTNPPVTGAFLIQTVRIEQIAFHGTTFPVHHVTASSVRFTLEDVFRRMSSTVSSITGNAATSTFATRVSYPNMAAYMRRGV